MRHTKKVVTIIFIVMCMLVVVYIVYILLNFYESRSLIKRLTKNNDVVTEEYLVPKEEVDSGDYISYLSDQYTETFRELYPSADITVRVDGKNDVILYCDTEVLKEEDIDSMTKILCQMMSVDKVTVKEGDSYEKDIN